MRRAPEIRFEFDKSVENQDRIEQILMDLQAERDARAARNDGDTGNDGNDENVKNDGNDEKDPT